VIWTGFKPVTHSLEGCCSIQLSYQTSFEFAKIGFLKIVSKSNYKNDYIEIV
jgi:hypothetical protein